MQREVCLEQVWQHQTLIQPKDWVEDSFGLILQATLFEELFFQKATDEIMPTVVLITETPGLFKTILTPAVSDPQAAEELCNQLIEVAYHQDQFVGAILNIEAQKYHEDQLQDILLQFLYLRNRKFLQMRMIPIERIRDNSLPRKIGSTLTLDEVKDFYITGSLPNLEG